MDSAVNQEGDLHLIMSQLSSPIVRISLTLICCTFIHAICYKAHNWFVMSKQVVAPDNNVSEPANLSEREKHHRIKSANTQVKLAQSMATFVYGSIRPNNDPIGVTTFTGLLRDLKGMRYKDVGTLLTFFVSRQKGVQDDKQLLLERTIQLLSRFNPNEKLSRQRTGGFVNTLWDERQHPNLSNLDARYKYRSADGSYNNILMPDLVRRFSLKFLQPLSKDNL